MKNARPRHEIEINQKCDSLSAPLNLMSTRMSPRASHRRHEYAILEKFPPAVLTAGFFVFQDGVNMASKWRIDGVFSDMRIEEMGIRFHQSRIH